MDAFFASVEQRDFPQYQGKPLAVGGNRERGVVAAASYEARAFGVYSAMPSSIAFQRCPEIVFVKPRFEVYKEVSQAIREIFSRYTDLIEPLSLDEAYLDVTENKKGLPSATAIAKEIKEAVRKELNLTASAGISINKFLAKIASDVNKPDGIFVIRPEEAIAFIEKLPVKKFFGVGKVTADKLHKMGVYFGRDLKQYSLSGLTSRFGKMGTYLYDSCRGIDNRKVNATRVRKSIGAERTLSSDIKDINELQSMVIEIAKITASRLINAQKEGKTITLKLKFSDFAQKTRSITPPNKITSEDDVVKIALSLVQGFVLNDFSIRLVGVSVSNFINEQGEEKPIEDSLANIQLTLDF